MKSTNATGALIIPAKQNVRTGRMEPVRHCLNFGKGWVSCSSADYLAAVAAGVPASTYSRKAVV